MEYTLTERTGRTQLHLQASEMGEGIVIRIFNENPHIGAIAVGEYDNKSGRTSVSMITRLGHKDDVLAHTSAYKVTKSTHRSTCVIAGVHLPDATEEEIQKFVMTNDLLITKLLDQFKS